jgi:hypothetical protein
MSRSLASMGQGVDLPSSIFIQIVEDGDWCSRIGGKKWWSIDEEVHGMQVVQQLQGGGD